MSTVNRITGLATGIDTESMITQLMEAQKAPLENLQKEQTTIEWQREALLEINSKMLSFRTEASDMKLQGTYKSYSASSSNSNIVSATTTAEAQEGTYKVKVRQLATQTTLKGSSDTISHEVMGFLPEDPDDYSDDERDQYTLAGKEFNITYNGTTKKIVLDSDINVSSSQDEIDDFENFLQNKVNEYFGTGQIGVNIDETFSIYFTTNSELHLPVTLSVSDSSNDALTVLGISDGESTTFNASRVLGGDEGVMSDSCFQDDEMTITLNGKSFTFNKADTISTVISTLNKDTDADVTIKYSDSQERFIVSRDSYGSGRSLTFGSSDSDIEFWEALGIDIDASSLSDSMEMGRNAIFDISAPDGESAQSVETPTNKFSYGGISMSFLEADENQTVSVTVSKNVDEIYDKIKTFVDAYNDILGTISKYYKEETSGYEPLTDSERENLSEKQEEQWEEKAKQGILRRDSTLQSAISSMRSAVTSMVSNSTFSSLFQIGISTVSYDSVNTENNGKLEIDEDVLRKAITDDIDGISTLFANTASMIQGGKVNIDNMTEDSLSGKSFSITYAGKTETITFTQGFDLSTTEGANEFEDYLTDIFDNKFGSGLISVSYANGRILFNSINGVNMQVNSVEGNDALSLMAIKDGSKYDSTNKGFAVKIYDICTSTMNSIIDKAGSVSNIVDSSTLGQALKRKKEAISTLEDRLEEIEERYYNQFAAMEEAISEMNSQSESLTSMLSSN